MLNSNEKCAVFLDIDGTLISDSFTIPPASIASAAALGTLIFIPIYDMIKKKTNLLINYVFFYMKKIVFIGDLSLN